MNELRDSEPAVQIWLSSIICTIALVHLLKPRNLQT